MFVVFHFLHVLAIFSQSIADDYPVLKVWPSPLLVYLSASLGNHA
jgi:hypothetical protein